VIWWLLENPGTNGVFNVGSGTDRTWNDLAAALFAAMGRDMNIEYIEMPGRLKDRYQYYTKAGMEKLTRKAGCPVSFTRLEDAVQDYVMNYLSREDPYLV